MIYINTLLCKILIKKKKKKLQTYLVYRELLLSTGMSRAATPHNWTFQITMKDFYLLSEERNFLWKQKVLLLQDMHLHVRQDMKFANKLTNNNNWVVFVKFRTKSGIFY